MHVLDVMQENAEMCDPSTMHGIAITHFCVARRQCVKISNNESSGLIKGEGAHSQAE